MRLEPHAVALQDPGGAAVAAIAPADDPVQAQALEPEPEQGPRRLGGEPAPLEAGMEDEPDLTLLARPAEPEQGAVPDELAGRGQLGRQAQGLALGGEGTGRDLPPSSTLTCARFLGSWYR
jgi:hypothetical protein